MLGDEPRLVSVPALRAFCCTCQVCAPVDEVAVAPGPPLPVAPYAMVIVAPPARVTPETVIVWATTETVPVLAVVKPAAVPVIEGALQPLGTTTVIAPFCMPPDAAV